MFLMLADIFQSIDYNAIYVAQLPIVRLEKLS